MSEDYRRTAVEAGFDVSGAVTPHSFTWHGERVQVEGQGRTWEEGDELCFLILAAGGQAFELRLDRIALRWRILRVSAGRAVA